MQIVCWNTQWRRSRSRHGSELRAIIERLDPELVCLPESYTDFMPAGWHSLFSHPDYGYPIIEGRRKVALWSKRPWIDAEQVGDPRLPSGRFIAGGTATSLGEIKAVGICVPWKAAHVSTGRKDRKLWQDHRLYLEALGHALHHVRDHRPTLLLGDLNQCIPRRTAPVAAYEALCCTLGDLRVWTSGDVNELDRHPVCHIGGSRELIARGVLGLSRRVNGLTVSDHDGLAVQISLASDQTLSTLLGAQPFGWPNDLR